ncbi:MAG TPA: hypothetical protein V6D35_12750 [Candidatus Sericytochromatia bacterium]
MVTTPDEVCVTTYYLEFPPLMTGEQRLSFFSSKIASWDWKPLLMSAARRVASVSTTT